MAAMRRHEENPRLFVDDFATKGDLPVCHRPMSLEFAALRSFAVQ